MHCSLQLLTLLEALCLLAGTAGAVHVNGTGHLGNLHYLILAPKSGQLGSNFTVSCALLSGETISSARARISTLRMTQGARNLSAEDSWNSSGQRGGVDSLTLSLALENDDSIDLSGSYQLSVELTGSSGSVYRNETSLGLKEPSFLTFVQTDKALYQPGQTVKFRVLCLSDSLRPVAANFTVLIKDAQGNLVDRIRHEVPAELGNASQAVMLGQFELADPPNLGTWRIEVSGRRGQQETKSFSVERYTLPKFTIDLRTPDFVHVDDASFNVTVAVRYTYNQAVHGLLQADIGPWRSCSWCKTNYNLLKRFSAELGGNSSEGGRTFFTFPMAEWRAALAERVKMTETAFDMGGTFDVKADVRFTEKFSGVVKTAKASFTIYGKKFQLSMEIPDVPFFLPGLKLPVKLLLKRPNGVAFTSSTPSDVRLSMDFSHRGKPKSLELFKGSLSESPSGTGLSLLVTVPDYVDFKTISFTAVLLDMPELQAAASLKPYMATTDDFLMTDLVSGANGVQVFTNQSSGIKAAFSAIVSQSRIRIFSKLDSQARTSVLLSPERIQEFIPSFAAVTFGIVDSGEIVASFVEHSVPSVTGKLMLSSNLTNDTAEPQSGASIGVSGEPNSFIFLTGIDASVNLIRTGQDILEDAVTNRLKSGVSEFREVYWARSCTTDTVLQKAGLQLLTDGFYYSEANFQFEERSMLFSDRLDNARPVAMASSKSVPPAASAQPEKSQKRNYFPETMLWTMVETDAAGRASQELQLPDTITSWDVTAFGISGQHAIQTVRRPFQVTTFKRFFAQPTLPHSMIRGESLLLRVLLFNYGSADGLTANVTLMLDPEAFELTALATGQAEASSPSAEVVVEANGVGLAAFSLRPRLVTEAAAVTVRARAVWPDGRVEVDEVTRTLPVLPEGRTEWHARTALLSLRGAVGSNSSADAENVRSAVLTIDWPEEVQADGSTLVPGSQLLSVAVVGDALGPAMDGIGSLVRTPHGCGEQNMVDFAPAIFVYRYLSADKDDVATTRLSQKALDAMRTGYQRELAFRRGDGSYSAFGTADPAGSAWLTAFVLSSFAQAAGFIAVDPTAVTGDSVNFLLSRQDVSGRFTEPEGARVLDSGLQGEAGKASLGMSAFICSALIDVRDAVEALPALRTTAWKLQTVATAVHRCVGLFEREFDRRPADFDTRDLALAAHFLWRARRSRVDGGVADSLADRVWTALKARAEKDGDLRFWKVSGRPSEEVTAYAVLTALLADERSEAAAESALPALRWLSGRQTDRGGFSSTQSTVVGVRAIAAFAAATGASSKTHAKVELLTSGTKTNATAEPAIINIEPADRRVLRRRLLARGADAVDFASVSVRASGSGLVLATTAWQFNMRDPQHRRLVADWTESSGLGLRLGAAPAIPNGAAFAFSVCARASGPQGMYILRVACPSGYVPEEFTGAGAVSGLQLVEAGPQQLVFYFDRLMEKDEVCVQSAWRRDVPVLNVQPQKITLQKYYQPEIVNTVFYLDPALHSVGQCQACPDCPGCPAV